jgi:hypothetical protein
MLGDALACDLMGVTTGFSISVDMVLCVAAGNLLLAGINRSWKGDVIAAERLVRGELSALE